MIEDRLDALLPLSALMRQRVAQPNQGTQIKQMRRALGLYGLPLSHAAAAVLVYHAVAFWIPTLGGMLAYTRLRPRLASPAPASIPATYANPST